MRRGASQYPKTGENPGDGEEATPTDRGAGVGPSQPAPAVPSVHETLPPNPDPNPVCTSLFDRLVSDDGKSAALMVHGDKLLHIEGWCPDCGTLITVEGRKITPGRGHDFQIMNGGQVWGGDRGVRKGTA